jgi:hypothetical protein
MPHVAAAQDDPKKCISVYENGQIARQDGQLRRARLLFLNCMDDSCPDLLRKDCSQWMEEVLAAIPTVIIDAHDPKGADVAGLRVWVDGESIVGWTDGKPLEMDPGARNLRLEAPGWPAVEKRLVVRHGDKGRKVEFQFGAARAPRPVPVGAYVLGGAGVLALGVSAALGIQGLRLRSDLSDSNCSPHCSQSDVDRTMSYFHWADALLAVGVVSVGVATYLVLRRPEAASADRQAGAVGLRVSAHATAGGTWANLALQF